MLCQKCGKNQANVFYKQMINGEYKEMAICGECAKDFDSPIKIMNEDFNIFGNLFKKPVSANELNPPVVCNLCGSTIKDIMKCGKAGCAKCYDTFRNELSNTILHIHGKTNHTGRAPHEYKIKNEKINKVNSLKAQLKDAIEKQEFETAAKLRDEINDMELGGS